MLFVLVGFFYYRLVNVQRENYPAYIANESHYLSQTQFFIWFAVRGGVKWCTESYLHKYIGQQCS